MGLGRRLLGFRVEGSGFIEGFAKGFYRGYLRDLWFGAWN